VVKEIIMASKTVSVADPRARGRLGPIVISASLVVALIVGLVIGEVLPLAGLRPTPVANTGQIEPQAGTWKTWVLTSGSQLRPAAPPDATATRAEIEQLKALAAQRDQAAQQRIDFWSVGAPAFRWNEIAVGEELKHNLNANRASRILALMNAAIYDATVATWDAKYAYNRPRPSEADSSLSTALPNPRSPS
jgi:hypothetical protein